MRFVACLVASAHAAASAEVVPGAFVSIAGSALSRGADDLVPQIVQTLKTTELPGQNETLFWFEPIKFDDVSIGDYSVDVLAGEGVQVSLKDMSNTVAHTRFSVHDVFNVLKCTGEIWASATGASYKAMNTLTLDEDGKGKLVVTTPAGGFDAGSVEVHHQMETSACEAAADLLHLVDSAIIDLLAKQLEAHLAGIISDAIEVPANQALAVLEFPPALGFGKEKFQLDNSFVSVDYGDNRITHFNMGQFKSTAHPKASSLTPPALAPAGERDVVFSFSDYVLNTLFESMFAEHIGETEVVLPIIKTLFDKECPHCPLVIKNTFGQQGQQVFKDGVATAEFMNMKWEVGALQNGNTVLPMVDLLVNVSLGVDFTLEQTPSNANLKAAVSLQDFEQDLIVSHIGDIDTSDLTRDIRLLALAGIDKLNDALPILSIPVVAGVKLANEKITTDKRELRVEADLVASGVSVLV